MQELLYTSAPKGLKPGSRGFCTVISSAGMSAPVATGLESLSAYRPVFPPGDPNVHLNPIAWSHLTIFLAGQRQHVLSRIADYGLDYSQRTNKIAHHVQIDRTELPTAGPAWTLQHSELMRSDWDGIPRVVSATRSIPDGTAQPEICHAWQAKTGDAGWAGVIAESFLNSPDRLVYIIYEPGTDVLQLIAEAISMLPLEKRWDVTFNTYFTKLPNGASCQWRCVLADSPEANESRRHVQALRINLTEPVRKASGGAYVTAARTGKFPVSIEGSPTLEATSRPNDRANNKDDAPIDIKTTARQTTAPPRRNLPPQARSVSRRQVHKRKSGLGVMLGIVGLLLITVTAILAMNWPQNTPVQVVQNSTHPKDESNSPPPPPPPQGDPRDDNSNASGEEAPDKDNLADNNPTQPAPFVPENPNPETPSQPEASPTEPQAQPEKVAPVTEVKKEPTNEILYWKPTFFALEKDREKKLLDVTSATETSQITVQMPHDLSSEYRFEDGCVKIKTVQDEDRDKETFSKHLTFSLRDGAIYLTPHSNTDVEKLNRFVLVIGEPQRTPWSTVFLHQPPSSLPETSKRLATAFGLPDELMKSPTESNLSSEKLKEIFQIKKLSLRLGEEIVTTSSSQGLTQEGVSHIAKGVKIKLSFPLVEFAKRKFGQSKIIDFYATESKSDLTLELLVQAQDAIEIVIVESSLGTPKEAVEVPVTQIYFNSASDFEPFEEHLLKACDTYWNKEVEIARNSVTQTGTGNNNGKDLKRRNPSFIGKSGKQSELRDEVKAIKGDWQKSIAQQNLKEDQKLAINRLIEMLDEVDKFLSDLHELRKTLNQDEQLELVGIHIEQRTINQTYMPFFIGNHEVIPENQAESKQ